MNPKGGVYNSLTIKIPKTLPVDFRVMSGTGNDNQDIFITLVDRTKAKAKTKDKDQGSGSGNGKGVKRGPGRPRKPPPSSPVK
jgi:hypothetical protein